MRSETRHHLAFIIRPPELLAAEIERQSALARGMMAGCTPPLSPPHVTLLYMPCSMLDYASLRRAAAAVRSTAPFTLRYAGIRVSSYGTVQLQVHPRVTLRQLHIDLVAAMGLDDIIHAPAPRLLELFGTANFGEAYSPHVTLGHFGGGSQAEDAAHHFTSLPELEQPLSILSVADATGRLDVRLSIRLQGLRPPAANR